MTHQKRMPAPKHYPIPRKQGKYVSSIEGSRSPDQAIPALLFLRDVTDYAENIGDAKEIVRNGQLLRNGDRIRDIREGIGVLDTVELPAAEESYRVIKKGNELAFVPVQDSEVHVAKIVDKRQDGDSFIYELHSGENYSSKSEHDTETTLVFEDGEFSESIELEEGVRVLSVGGSHAGETGELKEVQRRGMNKDTAVIENDHEFETDLENLVAINDSVEVSYK